MQFVFFYEESSNFIEKTEPLNGLISLEKSCNLYMS